jgi:DNA-binding GntR family transcriptional regulator
VDLTLDDLRSLFEMREALEGMACALAAARISDQALARLEGTLAQHAVQPEVASGQSYYQPGGDRDFHFGIAAASGNARLIRTLSSDIYDVMRVYRYRSALTPGRAVGALEEHHVILAALRARDPARAEEAMRAHIKASWENTRHTFMESA